MPELPEVEVVRAKAERACSGRIIRSVMVRDSGVLYGCSADELDSFCRDRAVLGVSRHGKQLFIELDRGGYVTVHLGMTGDLVFREGKGRASKYDRVILDFKDGSRLAYEDMRKFGAIGHATSVGQFLELKRLGPDALKVGRREFASRVGKSHRAIKTVLLDQTVIAGVGNLYADEALFQSRIHPLTPADELSEKETSALHGSARKVLMASVRVASDFDRLPKTYMLPVRGPGLPCPRGNGAFVSIKISGRTTYYCPSCQTTHVSDRAII